MSISSNSQQDRLTICGDLENHSIEELIPKGQRFIDQAPENCYIDLAFVSRVSSVSFALLLNWLRYARQQNKQIHFLNIPDKLFHIAKVSGFELQENGIQVSSF